MNLESLNVAADKNIPRPRMAYKPNLKMYLKFFANVGILQSFLKSIKLSLDDVDLINPNRLTKNRHNKNSKKVPYCVTICA